MHLVYIIPLFLSAVSAASVDILKDGEISPNFYFIGEVSGRKYYADLAAKSTWAAAKVYCTNLGMRMASIETIEQAAFLNSKAGLGEFTGLFWTAGKDALELRQFSWDGTDTQPASHPTANLDLETAGLNFVSCLAYNAARTITNRYQPFTCTTAAASALCEI